MNFGLILLKKESAYACIFFSSMFFQHYSCRNVPELCRNKNYVQQMCKLVIKAVLPVFRCLNTLEKNVEKCIIYTNFSSSHIVFQLLCKHGIVKTHNLAFQESEPLQAVFAKHLCPNRLKIQTRQLSDILIHFPTYQDEITLAVTPVKVCFKTYVEDEMDFAKTMHTEIHLRPEEFEYFQVGVDSEVTFCLKELKGLLAFAEAISAPVSVHFDVSGKPVAFSIEDVVIEASFVLATLADTENMTSSHYSPYPVQDQKRSPALERSNKDIISNRNLKDTETATTDNCTIMGKVVPPDPEYDKFHSLFFGAVSSKEKDIIHVFHSLATESDTEEDSGNGEISQTF
ncbi:cell cycle checkpoint control protein RAD9B isoform X2 [Hemicordylus capensis]|uniref:cell cycle checkpoint control protein RAD9B isoform X2 n=1 Tax=Hemicordylus capensis TaxID=884348 RepID=UPI00230260B0|nr:cell cycle checkpoint control protein RAD9B isoform X2 [Hemicordylus capensis]XP_053135717.1 cell cycle checkpoint control protein RAD9B isoform X2 [Hemicordylus capensis]